MMSVTRVSILFLGLVAILILGTWGWTELANAVYRSDAGDAVVALMIYGVSFLVIAVVAGFTFFVLSFRNDDLG
ncbi:MAG: hypothetical protein OXL37_15610 [Chloroflexota bacterium]|nr:hypothetical protein [Chloroflexota bacterium]MDE2961858.1 hypothetical protein [Chloroflexota bacterium]